MRSMAVPARRVLRLIHQGQCPKKHTRTKGLKTKSAAAPWIMNVIRFHAWSSWWFMHAAHAWWSPYISWMQCWTVCDPTHMHAKPSCQRKSKSLNNKTSNWASFFFLRSFAEFCARFAEFCARFARPLLHTFFVFAHKSCKLATSRNSKAWCF